MDKEQTISFTANGRAASLPPQDGAFRRGLASVVSLLSSAVAVICPACIPALGSLLASLGLGFAVTASFLQPLLIVLLSVSLLSLVWAAKLHGNWFILLPAIVGASFVYIARFVSFHPVMRWTGAALLIGTSIVNFRLKRKACCRCAELNKEQT